MKKRCPARGCSALIPRSRAFCRDHWFQIPKPLRDAIWGAHRRKDRTASLRNIREAMRLLAKSISDDKPGAQKGDAA